MEAVNPATGEVTEVSDFADILGNCPSDPFQFPSMFDRLAQTAGAIGGRNGTRAGWYTPNGDFIAVGPAATTPDFGLPTMPFTDGGLLHE